MLSLYLRRSFRRSPLRHFALFWILMCAFILPLVLSIYRDSLAYGVVLQNFNIHKGQVIHITGAQPEDTAWFQDIDGLTTPYYEDGIIYMTYASAESEARYQDVHERLSLSFLLNTRARQSSRRLDINFYGITDPLADPYMHTTLLQMQLANLALLVFAGLIVQAAYRNHISAFSQELSDLAALGASKGQVIAMFLLEFGLLFPLASFGAIGISWAVMWLLYEKFLGNQAASVAIWRVFHMDIRNTALQIGIYLLACLAAMACALLKKPARRHLSKPKRPAALPRLWMQRTKPPFAPCLAILIPLLTAFVILFNQYLGTYAQNVYSARDARMIVDAFPERGFSKEELDFISGIDGVNRVECTWDDSALYQLRTPELGVMLVSVHLDEELPAGTPKLEKYQFLTDYPEPLGTDGPCYFGQIVGSTTQLEITPAGIIPPEEGEQAYFRIYVTRELMQEFYETVGYQRLYVYPAAAQAGAVEAALRHKFGESINIANFQNYVDTTARQQEGHLWLLSWIFCILMLVSMQIVWVRLAKYVRDCAPMLRIVRQLGASRQQLSRLIPVKWGVIPAAVLPFLIAIPYAWLDARKTGRPFILSVPVLGIYLLIAALAALTFWLPVKHTLRKVLNERKR